MYIEKTIYMYAKVLILLTVINLAISVVYPDYNILLTIVRTPKNIRILYIIVALLALWVGFKRETYLPFLGECVLPPTVLKPGSNVSGDKLVQLEIEVGDAQQIVWWGSQPATGIEPNPDVMKAYGDYMNSGVAKVEKGVAKIAFLCPQEYLVKKTLITKHLKKHIHYREVHNNGMLGAIKTINVDC